MSKLLAVEWDLREIRLVLAEISRRKLRLRETVRVELPPLDEGEKGPHPELVAKLRATLAAYRWERVPALLCISRAGVELRPIQTPPAPDQELPELVRNVLLREIGPAVENATVDFVAGPMADGARGVLAALLSNDALEQLQAQSAEAELRPLRICLRPMGAAALARRAQNDAERTRLLVDAAAWEADLTVLAGEQVVFCRTTRLHAPADDETAEGPLLDEVRRTLVAFQNMPGGQRVDELVLCGDPRQGGALQAALEREFELPVAWLDPWTEADASFDNEPPRDRGRFVALIGMLREEADGRRQAIDFLHPKRPRRAAAPGRNRGLLFGAAAAVALLLLFGWTWSQRAEIQGEIAELKTQSRELDNTLKRAAKKQAIVSAVDQWQRGDRVWLDELAELSQRFPKRRDAVVTRITMGKTPEGARVDLEGLVRDHAIVGRLEQSLRDESRQVQSGNVQVEGEEDSKVWKFETSITVAAESEGAKKKTPAAKKATPARTAAVGGRER